MRKRHGSYGVLGGGAGPESKSLTGFIERAGSIIVRPSRLAFGQGMMIQAVAPRQRVPAAGGPEHMALGKRGRTLRGLYRRAVEQLLVEFDERERY